ncbi:MAG: M81 family metallopeptidase [Rhizomicrobium sp.]
MRIFTAAFGAETNTFSPIPTSLTSFAEQLLLRPGEHPDHAVSGLAPNWAVRQRGRAQGWDVIEGTCAWAGPAGPLVRTAFETIAGEILTQLAAALPVDAVVLSLHGAMVAQGIDDCEGELLRRIRACAGPHAVIGVHLDPHCVLSELMVDKADIIVCMKEYPHTDFVECSDRLVDLVASAHARKIRPVMTLRDCRMIGVYHTTRSPMMEIVARMHALEKQTGILSVSIAHGFPWCDVPESGTRVLVVTDGDAVLGEQVADIIEHMLRAVRGTTMNVPVSMKEAVRQAAARTSGTIVLADISDNPGGGAPGDSTFLLKALLECSARAVCLGPLWDPQAVKFCHAAGEGAELALRVGGKVGAMSGEPLDLSARVTALSNRLTQTFAGQATSLGPAAAVHVAGIDVVLVSERQQGLGPDLFSNIGIDPRARRVVVVKSSQHFHAGFAPLAEEILYVGTPGALQLDFRSLPYRRIARPIWPLDDVSWDI